MSSSADTSLQREGRRRRTGPCEAGDSCQANQTSAAATMTTTAGPLALGMMLHRAVASRAAAAAAMASAHHDDLLIMALHPPTTPRTGTREATPIMTALHHPATPAGREAARPVQRPLPASQAAAAAADAFYLQGLAPIRTHVVQDGLPGGNPLGAWPSGPVDGEQRRSHPQPSDRLSFAQTPALGAKRGGEGARMTTEEIAAQPFLGFATSPFTAPVAVAAKPAHPVGPMTAALQRRRLTATAVAAAAAPPLAVATAPQQRQQQQQHVLHSYPLASGPPSAPPAPPGSSLTRLHGSGNSGHPLLLVLPAASAAEATAAYWKPEEEDSPQESSAFLRRGGGSGAAFGSVVYDASAAVSLQQGLTRPPASLHTQRLASPHDRDAVTNNAAAVTSTFSVPPAMQVDGSLTFLPNQVPGPSGSIVWPTPPGVMQAGGVIVGDPAACCLAAATATPASVSAIALMAAASHPLSGGSSTAAESYGSAHDGSDGGSGGARSSGGGGRSSGGESYTSGATRLPVHESSWGSLLDRSSGTPSLAASSGGGGGGSLRQGRASSGGSSRSGSRSNRSNRSSGSGTAESVHTNFSKHGSSGGGGGGGGGSWAGDNSDRLSPPAVMAWHSSEEAAVEAQTIVSASAGSQLPATARVRPPLPYPHGVAATAPPNPHVAQPEGLPPRPEPRFTMPELLLRHVQERRRQLSQQG